VGVRSDESRRVVVFPKSKGRSEGKNSFWRFRSSSFHLSQILELPISRRTAITRATRPNSVLLVSTSPNRPYEGLEGAAEGSGPPETVLVVLDALVVAVDLVAEPGDAVPVAAPEGRGARLLEVWGHEIGGGRVWVGSDLRFRERVGWHVSG
jgi:hypothetical protein